ncbi:MAG: UDP-N-acetylmuramoyl-tripeptide--D-alanyl-D-alanine ligase, partial [Oscillospiraceae bacterium]|nr:UDP-N-acetylmuramoyl-tripeptide--D-alanyl-D-alanine ligase [Oscillospiraceae bacterium]
LELKKNPGSYAVIDDAFNSNPTGAKEAINVLGKFDGYKKILVTPGFVELGEMEEKYHYELGAHASKLCDYIILVGRERCKPIEKGLLENGYNQECYYMAENFKDALAKLSDIADNSSVVLFENDLPDNYEVQN